MAEFLSIPDSELQREGHVLLFCEHCSKPRNFVFRNLQYELRSELKATFTGFPVLWCEDCKKWAIPSNLRCELAKLVEQSKYNGEMNVVFEAEGGRQEVNYNTYPKFKFCSADYIFYPGLWRPSQDGALTPVFFRRRVLHRYSSDPDYDLHYISNSYGTVVIPPGHHIPFGINRQGLVIMWLGDISELPEDEIHYLQSENVDSDHDLFSDFYLGQIETQWDYQSLERTLLELHQKLSERFKTEWDVRLSKFDPDQITEALKSFAEPALWTFKELGNVWQSMNHVLIESLNVDGLRKLIKKYEPDFDTKNLKGLKLLQKVLETAMVEIPASTMSSFFVLYDLRVIASHKASESMQTLLKSCYERLKLNPEIEDLKGLHTNLIRHLCQSYKTMIACPIKQNVQNH